MLKRHSQIIVSHVEELVAETILDNLIPEVISRKVFTREMVNRILGEAGGNVSDQSRALYLQVPKRGPLAFSGLVAALLHSGHERLGRMLLQADGGDNPILPPYPRDSPDSCFSGHNCGYSHIQPFALPQYMTDQLKGVLPTTEKDQENFVVDFQMNMARSPIDVVHATEERKPNPGSVVKYYRMMSKPRGYALIINNIRFEYLSQRRGAERDDVAMKDLLEKLYFEVECHIDKKKHEMVDIVEQFAAKGEWSNVDCCWVVLMSHGQEGNSEEETEILGTDSVGFKTRDVLSYFYNDSCPKLRDKPKIFVFQSCRGQLIDSGIKARRFGEPGPYSYHHRTETDGKPQDQFFYLRSRSDMFIAYPVPPGMKANRDVITGAWFIQNIVRTFAMHAYEYELEDLFKIVDDNTKEQMRTANVNHQTVTTRTIGWYKKLFFNPGLFYQNGEVMREIDETDGVIVLDNKQNGRMDDTTVLTRVDDDGSDEESKTCFSCRPL